MNQQRINQILAMLKKDDESVFLNYVLALEYQSGNKLEEAIPLFRTIIKKDNEYLAAYFQLGRCCASVGQKEEALKVFELGIEMALKKGDRKTYGEMLAEKQMLGE